MTEVLGPSDRVQTDEPLYRTFENIKLPKGYIELLYPHALFLAQERQFVKPQEVARSALQAGILADRGYVIQQIGDEIKAVEVKDFEEYPLYSGQIGKGRSDHLLRLGLSPTTARIIAQSSSVEIETDWRITLTNLTVDPKLTAKWFLKALNLWEIHSEGMSLEFAIGNNRIPFDLLGLRQTWERAGFHIPEIRKNDKAVGPKNGFHIHIPVDGNSFIVRGY